MKERSAECAAIRDLMLEAEPAQLLAHDDSPLALHLRECVHCSRAAARIMDAQSQLDAAIRTLTAAGAATASRPAVTRATDAPIAVVRGRSLRRRVLLSAPLAAAALLALLILGRGVNTGIPLPGPAPRIALADDAPVVNVEGSADVAIMRTSNPNITVVWYLNRENR